MTLTGHTMTIRHHRIRREQSEMKTNKGTELLKNISNQLFYAVPVGINTVPGMIPRGPRSVVEP